MDAFHWFSIFLIIFFSTVCFQKTLHSCCALQYARLTFLQCVLSKGFTLLCCALLYNIWSRLYHCHCLSGPGQKDVSLYTCECLSHIGCVTKKGLNPHEDRPILFVFQNSFVTSFSVPILSPGISLLNWGIQINQYVVFGVSNFAFMRVGRLCSCLFSVHVCVFLCAVVQGCSCLFVPGYVQVYVWYTLYIRVWVHMVQ